MKGNYELGLELAKERKFKEAEPFFKKCIEDNPKDLHAYYQLLMISIALKKYSEFKDICAKLKEFDDPRIVSNANYYLYLFQFISREPLNLNINVKDILLGEEETERNSIRKVVYAKNFKAAGDILHNRFISGSNDDKVETLLESKLINLIKNNSHKNKDNYRNLIAIKYYEKLFTILEEKEKQNIATKHEKYLKKLCLQYIRLSKGEIIEFNTGMQGDFFSLIDQNDYEGALKQNINYDKSHDNPDKNNLFTLALQDVCWLNKKLSHQRKIDEKLIKENRFDQEISNFYRKFLSQSGFRTLRNNVGEEELEQIKAYAEEVGEIRFIPIKDEQDRDRYVIIYKENSDDKGDLENADALYNKKRYFEAISEYLKIIQTNDSYPKDIYIKLTNSLYNIKNYREASTFCRLAFNEEQDLDKKARLLDLAIKIKKIGKEKSEANKEHELKEGNVKKTNSTLDFNSVNEYIIANNLDVSSACEELGLSQEDTNIIKLIYAREYYKCHMEKIGNSFIKSVEESSEKSNEINALLKKIKQMKKIYLNQPISNEYSLPFNIRPESKKGPSY